MKKLKIGLLILLFSQIAFSNNLSTYLNAIDDSHIYVVLEWETSNSNRVDLDLKLKSPGNKHDRQTLYYGSNNDNNGEGLEWASFIYDHRGNTDKTTEKVSEMLALDIYDSILFDIGEYKFYVSRWSGGGETINAELKFYINGKRIDIKERGKIKIKSTKEDEYVEIAFNNSLITSNIFTLEDNGNYELVIGENRGGEYDSGLGVGRGNYTYIITDKTFGFGEIITKVKEVVLANTEKISTLSIGIHGNKLSLILRGTDEATSSIQQFLTYSKYENHSPGKHDLAIGKSEIINLFVYKDDYIWKTESLYARSRLRSLRKYLSRKDFKLPSILIWGCQVGNNIDLLKAIAFETNAIVHANTQYSGSEFAIKEDGTTYLDDDGNTPDFTLDVVVCPNGKVSYIEGRTEQCYQ